MKTDLKLYLQKTGFQSKDINDIDSLTKMAMLYDSKLFGREIAATDVILNKVQVEERDIEVMLNLFEGLKDPENGVVSPDSLEWQKSFDARLLSSLSEVPVSVTDQMDASSLQSFRSLKSGYDRMFSNLHNQTENSFIDKNAYNSLHTIESFGNISVKRKYGNGNPGSGDYRSNAISGDIVYNMLEPVVMGKTVAQVNDMYTVDNKGKSYVDYLSSFINRTGYEINIRTSGEDFELTDGNFQSWYQVTNKISGADESVARANRNDIRDGYFRNIATAKNQFVRNGGVIAEHNIPAPVVLCDANVPDYRAAASKIAMKAAESIGEYYQKNDASIDDEILAEIKNYYSQLVYNQVCRVMLENGYEKKVDATYYKQDLAPDMDNFAHSVISDVLPFFLTQEMVDNATKTAFEGFLEEQAIDEDLLKDYDPAIKYTEVEATPASASDVNKEINYYGLQFGDEPLIGIHNLQSVENTKMQLGYDDEQMLKNLSLKSAREYDIDRAGYLFDHMLQNNNAQFFAFAKQDDVKDYCGTYIDEKGVEQVNLTKLFYIDGVSAESYVKSQLGSSTYDKLSEKDKLNYTKAAIFNNVFSDRHGVYVKRYQQLEDKSVMVAVSTVVDYTGDSRNFKLSEKDEEHIRQLSADDGLAQSINAKTEAKMQSLHKYADTKNDAIAKRQREMFNENNVRLHRHIRESGQRLAEDMANRTPEDLLRPLQQELNREINLSDNRPIERSINLSQPGTIDAVSIISGLDTSAQEDKIRDINFKAIVPDSIFNASDSFDRLILNEYPWINDSIYNPEVIRDYKLDVQPKDGVKERADVTKLFYIDGEPVESYLKTVMPDYDRFNAAEKEHFGKMAVMNALLTGEHAVDAKGYEQKGNGKCEVKVTNIVYGPAYDKTEYSDQLDGIDLAEERAKRIIADDPVSKRINRSIDHFVQTNRENTLRAEARKANLESQINDILVPDVTQFNGLDRVEVYGENALSFSEADAIGAVAVIPSLSPANQEITEQER
ncbi:MAG: hypothetical protein LUI60_05990, partial [Clostridia bacterium]|nr:hypothetical protein [Clostridia bacterium]